MDRSLTFSQALREAMDQAMAEDPSVVLMGQGVDDAKGTLGTTLKLHETYGADRAFDTPLSEEGMTGAAVGMALAGLKPVHVHIRMDFLLLALNQMLNVAAKMHYMYGGRENVPMVIRAIIGKSWGQGAQHSQALHSLFMHFPGIKVVAPATPYDAKGCLQAAIKDPNPVLFIEHRLLHYQKGHVPENMYTVKPGKSRRVTVGTDVTLVGISYMQLECFRAHSYLADAGISAEVIDPIWLSPLDTDTIVESVKKTGRLCVVDNGWLNCGASAEIVARVCEAMNGQPIQIKRMGFAPVPCPPSPPLEDLFYPNARTIAAAVQSMVKGGSGVIVPDERPELKAIVFKGPF